MPSLTCISEVYQEVSFDSGTFILRDEISPVRRVEYTVKSKKFTKVFLTLQRAPSVLQNLP